MIRLGSGDYFGETVTVRRFGPFAVTASRYPAGHLLPQHCHEQAAVCVVLAGGMTEQALGRETVCTRGWLVYNGAGEEHQDRVLAGGAEGLNIDLPSEWLPRLREAVGARETVSYRHAGAEVTAVGALQVAMGTPDSLQALRGEEAIVRLLDSLCHAGQRHGRPPRWLARAEELIRDRHRGGLRLGDVADAAGVHPAHLCREFRRCFGCTMTQYAARLRADAALEEVLRSAVPLAAVAARAGFADQAHLTRAIRKHFGTTPGALRRGRANGVQDRA
jgi:AraC family transcriptional regulator